MKFLDDEIIVEAEQPLSWQDAEVEVTFIPDVARSLADMLDEHADEDAGWLKLAKALREAADHTEEELD